MYPNHYLAASIGGVKVVTEQGWFAARKLQGERPSQADSRRSAGADYNSSDESLISLIGASL
jgi:phosphoglucomutase